jgi:protein-S-isoprenylcysteine O-methyltransferase Ste14
LTWSFYNTAQVTAPASGRGTFTTGIAVAGALVFVASLGYAVWSYGWRFGTPAPRSAADVWSAIVDVLLFTLFALHHSIFARAFIKDRVAALVSPPLERSAYVWLSSVLFVIVLAAWRPVGGVLWRTDGLAALALGAVQITGVAVTLQAARALDVLSLAGLRQALGVAAPAPALVDTGLYGFVRHPVYFGWALMVWATPTMTGTRLVFAAVSTLYLALAIPLEERALRSQFGAAYDRYAARVRWRMLRLLY